MNKTAVVTGTSKGIGEAVAACLLRNGWKVYGVSRSKPSFTDSTFVWLECDLAKTDAIAAALQHVTEPALDLLVSNAGVAFPSWATDVTSESYGNMYDVNVLAPMLIVHALKAKLSHATVISTSSVSDRLLDADYALYCSSKAANTTYFGSLAAELQDATIITLLPDYVDTPMLRGLHKDDGFDWSAPLKAGDIASLVANLESGKIQVESGANIIIVNDALQEDLASTEKLYGFNTDTEQLVKLSHQ